MMKKIVINALMGIGLLTNSCKDESITEPEPGRRDYAWAVDTIIMIHYKQLIHSKNAVEK